MAEMTLVIGSIADDSGQARLEIDVDDTSDPADWALIRLRCVNGMTRGVFVDIRRGNGTSFWSIPVSGGQTLAENAGGPVRTEADVPVMMLRTT